MLIRLMKTRKRFKKILQSYRRLKFFDQKIYKEKLFSKFNQTHVIYILKYADSIGENEKAIKKFSAEL